MTTAAARLKGLTYLALIIGLVAGIPTGLYIFGGNPLAVFEHINTLDKLKNAFMAQDDGTLFLGALGIIGWIAWATFASSIVIELAAALRGARPPKIRGLQVQQRSAAFLVGGALLLLTAGTATAAPAQQIAGLNHTAPTSISAPAFTQLPDHQKAPSAPAFTQTPAQLPPGETITTTAGDTLWGLAERHLGDGTRYTEIRDLNRIADDSWIEAGWNLTLPAAAQAPIAGAYTVQAGDTLWDIAEGQLGSGFRYHEIQGLAGPLSSDTLHVGQQLLIGPAAASSGQAPASAPVPAPVPIAVTLAPAPETASPAALAPHSAAAPAPETTTPVEGTPAPPLPAEPRAVEAPGIPESSAHSEVPADAPAANPAPDSAPAPAPIAETAAPVVEAAAPPLAAEAPTPAGEAPTTAPEIQAGAAQPGIMDQSVPELPEMVPGGDEMSQAEARAAAEAAAKIFNLPPNAALGLPVPVAAPAPAVVPAVPSPVVEAPTAAPAVLAPEVAPPAPTQAPVPAPEMPSQNESAQNNTVETLPEAEPESAPEPVEVQAPPVLAAPATSAAPVPAASDTALQVPLNTAPDPATENTALSTPLAADADQGSHQTALGISALAAIALVAGLGVLRRRQQNRRRRGETIPLPAQTAAAVEERVRAAANTDLIETLDAALRNLADHCRTNNLPLPALLGVFLHTDTLELALIDDIDLPAPWVRSEHSGAWTLAGNATVHAPVTAVSPYPSLVELGDVDDGSRILLNLEELGHLSIAAPTNNARDIVRALAVFLAFSPIADNLHLTLVGTGKELPELVDNGRLTYAPDADQVLERLARHTTTDANHLTTEGIDSVAAARTTYQDSEMTAPEIVLLAEPLTPSQRAHFDEILSSTPRVAFAAVTAADDPTADWTLTADKNGHAQLAKNGGVAFDLTPTQLTGTEYDAIVDILATAHDDAEPTNASTNDAWAAAEIDNDLNEATHADQLIPPAAPHVSAVPNPSSAAVHESLRQDPATEHEPEGSPDSAATAEGDTDSTADEPIARPTAVPTPPAAPITAGHIWIRLLGTPKVTPLSGEPAPKGREGALTELASLLATEPGLLHTQIDAKIWPVDNFEKLPTAERDKSRSTRRQTTLTRLRNWLGTTDQGNLALPKVGDRTGKARYSLDPDVLTDIDIWNNLVGARPANATDDDLATAATLVTGIPFNAANPTKYGWAEVHRQNMISKITDALEELSARRVHRGNLKSALETAKQGLTIDPYHEGLWRLAIIATHGSADIDATQQLIDEMLGNLASLDVFDPHPETSKLLEMLDRFHNSAGERPYRITRQAS